MSYTLLLLLDHTARKDHRCIWCGQAIRKGEKYRRERSVFDGDMQSFAWHPECFNDAQHNNEEAQWEFTPYSYERPNVLTQIPAAVL